eukprot:2435-Pelagococcus_subviridis.AAC.1
MHDSAFDDIILSASWSGLHLRRNATDNLSTSSYLYSYAYTYVYTSGYQREDMSYREDDERMAYEQIVRA